MIPGSISTPRSGTCPRSRPRSRASKRRGPLAERASLPLAEALRSDEGVTRLVQRLALSERFHFFLLVCDTPRVARATFDVLAEEVPSEREAKVSLVRIDPYEAHADLRAPIPFTLLVDQVLVRLVSPRP